MTKKPVFSAESSSAKIGDRVIVRRSIPGTPGHLTDVIGHVISLSPLEIRPQSVGGFVSDATSVRIDWKLVQALKVLPPRRVRNSEIRAIEYATAEAFPGIEHLWLEGWLLRAGDGITERSNSAAPIGSEAAFSPVPVRQIEEFYDRHDLVPRILVPDRIAPVATQFVKSAGWIYGPEIIVMTHDLESVPCWDLPAGFRFEIADSPSADWLELYHFRGEPLPVHALELLQSEIKGVLGFGSVLTSSGETVAITRGTITESPDGQRHLGYSAVEVAPAYRRRGLATSLGYAMLGWGAEQGANHAYLQVVATNEAGIGLYEKMGFVEHHRHRYAAKPSSES